MSILFLACVLVSAGGPGAASPRADDGPDDGFAAEVRSGAAVLAPDSLRARGTPIPLEPARTRLPADRRGASPTPEDPAHVLFAPALETAVLVPSFVQGSETRDRWFGSDKLRHLTAGLLGTLSTQYVLTEKVGMARGPALAIATGATTAAGLGKEWHDRRAGRFFSLRDLAADALGIGLAAGIVFL